MSAQVATKPTEKTTPEIFSREFFVSAGRRGGRPRFTDEEKLERAIQRLQNRLAELRSGRPCRTRTSDDDTEVRSKRGKQHRSPRRSARSVPNRKAAR